MTGAEIMAVVGFFVTLFLAALTVWKYVDSKIAQAKSDVSGAVVTAAAKAELAIMQLADYKHEVAQTYATKDGMAKQTEQMLRAIEGVANRIDGLNERLDNIILQRPATRRAS